MSKLPTRALLPAIQNKLNNFFHVVDPDDTTQDPTGSSFKGTGQQMADLIYSAQDKFMVRDSSGIPSFFATYALAKVAASAPDTIYFLTNVTEDIVLIAGQNIVGNGYTLTGRITMVTTIDVSIYGLNVVNNDISNPPLTVSDNSTIDVTDSTFSNTLGTTVNVTSASELHGGKSIGKGVTNAGILNNHTSESSTSDAAITNTGIINFCTGNNSSTGDGINMTAGESNHCKSFSASGVAFRLTNGLVFSLVTKSDGSFAVLQTSGSGILTDIYAYSTAERAIVAKNVKKAFAYSTAGIAAEISEIADDITATSTVSEGMSTAGTDVLLTDCTSIGISDHGFRVGNSGTLRAIHCKFISQFDNASGHALFVGSGTALSILTDCYYETKNVGASAIVGQSTVNVKVTASEYNVSSGVAFGANITQTEARLQDQQGNRFVN